MPNWDRAMPRTIALRLIVENFMTGQPSKWSSLKMVRGRAAESRKCALRIRPSVKKNTFSTDGYWKGAQSNQVIAGQEALLSVGSVSCVCASFGEQFWLGSANLPKGSHGLHQHAAPAHTVICRSIPVPVNLINRNVLGNCNMYRSYLASLEILDSFTVIDER